MRPFATACVVLMLTLAIVSMARGDDFSVTVQEDQITISTPALEAAVRKQGYVTGIYRGTFLDKKTGFRDAGFGLDIVDWIMEPGSDEAYRDRLDKDLIYLFDTPYHGARPKRSIEGPQICTKARRLDPKIIRGEDFLGVTMSYTYQTAAPGKRAGSVWEQRIVFPQGKRFFLSSDSVTSVNASEAMFQRIDMPGHIRHKGGDTFSEVYLSYLPLTNDTGGHTKTIPASAFSENFAPDAKFNYRRDRVKAPPKRFIRAYHLRDPKTGKAGPWLAGMTLDPSVVYEAWCHQRNYVCLIEEYGGRPIEPGETFSAAFIVGYFDSIDEMHAVYDQYQGATGLQVNPRGWRLTKRDARTK